MYKTCIILYGFLNFVQLVSLASECDHILLIEPRKNVLDYLCKNKSKYNNKQIITIPRILSNSHLKEQLLYYTPIPFAYRNKGTKINEFLENIQYYTKPMPELILTSEKGYTMNMDYLVNHYKIQNIKDFIINLDINNVNDILADLMKYNHIVSRIKTKTSVQINLDYYDKLPHCDYFTYIHKNMNIDMPKIIMFTEPSDDEKLDLILKQYDMDVVYTNNKDTKSIYLYDHLVCELEQLFTNSKKYDVILFFNSKYVASQVFQLLYPLQDNTLYINKDKDTIYGTWNAMYMLYQILKSMYFQQYIESKKDEVLYKVLYKKYFYEYISRSFQVRYLE